MKLLAALLLVMAVACGRTVPHGGVPIEPAKPATSAASNGKPLITTVTTATDLLPADLDLVVRVDLAKVRADLGKEASLELISEALDSSGVEGIARKTLADADVVWLGLRVADLDRGDHVMVATQKRKRRPEGAAADSGDVSEEVITPDPIAWTRSDTTVQHVHRFVAKGSSQRADTARIYTVGKTAAVFVSPVEEHSVERLLMSGPDPSRGDPTARGLVSLDLQAPRLSPEMSKKIPALAKLIASITRVRATADLFGDRIELEGTIRCKDALSAGKVQQYLATFTTPESRFAELLADTNIERSGASVLVRWRVPRVMLSGLLRHGDGKIENE
jgi:hypothetical protein